MNDITQIDFLCEIRKAYLEARNISIKNSFSSKLLSRGTSHSISSKAEDLFGCYIADKIRKTSKFNIVVDPQILFEDKNLKNKNKTRSLLIRPDVALINNKIATCFFDVKMDLGYKRNDFIIQAKEREAQLSLIRGKDAYYNDGKSKNKDSKLNIKISDKIKLIYVVISDGNINKEHSKKIINDINKLKNVEIYLLSLGHLNIYDDDPKYTINTEDFNEVDKILDALLKT
jgi:hypothetical protein